MRRIRARRTTWLADRLRTLDAPSVGVDRSGDPCAHAARRVRRVTTLAFALRARTFRSLRRHRNYRIFFTGQLVSLAGTWMQNVALAWLVIELSGSALAIGALAFWRFIPFTVFGLVAGVVADRFESRKLVMATQASRDGHLDRPRGRHARPARRRCRSSTSSRHSAASRSPSTRRGASRSPSRWSGRASCRTRSRSTPGLFNGSRVIGPAIAGLVIAAVGTGALLRRSTR